MTASELVQATYLRTARKTTTLLTTSAKYAQILALGNYWQRRWAQERGTDWHSLYNPALSIGKVTATDSFDLDSSIRKLSEREGDVVRILWSDGVGYTDYDIIQRDKLKDTYWGQTKNSPNGFYCTQMGDQLVFNDTFASTDKQFGGDIRVPAYVFTDTLVNPTDEVQVDDPDWLVAMVSADYCRSTITLRDQYPILLAEANDIMTRMREDNVGQVDNVDMPWTPLSGIGADSAWS
jgi:hypothetical protein